MKNIDKANQQSSWVKVQARENIKNRQIVKKDIMIKTCKNKLIILEI